MRKIVLALSVLVVLLAAVSLLFAAGTGTAVSACGPGDGQGPPGCQDKPQFEEQNSCLHEDPTTSGLAGSAAHSCSEAV